MEVTMDQIVELRLKMRDQAAELVPEGYVNIDNDKLFTVTIQKEGDCKVLIQIRSMADLKSTDGEIQAYYMIRRLGNYIPFKSDYSLKVDSLEDLREVINVTLKLLSLEKTFSEIKTIRIDDGQGRLRDRKNRTRI